MENSYGIGVANRYELFYDEDVDPLDIIKQTEQKVKDKQCEKENKGTTKVIPKKSGTVLKKVSKDERTPKMVDKTNISGEGRPQNQRGRNNNSQVKFQDREERNNRRNRSDNDFNANRFEGGENRRMDGEGGRGRFDGESRPRFDGEGRGRGRGRGMGRGARGGRGGRGGPMTGGKREFDRQSGMVTSGVKAVDKREGSGQFNWGSDKDQIEDYNQPEEAPELDTSNENVEKTAEEPAAPVESGEEAAKEEEHREMTLDEWKALQGQRSKPQFNIRKAGEGENTAQWKKTYILKKKIEDEDDDEEEEEEDEDEIQHGRRKVLLDIDFKFSDSPMRGRGRGRGRGGERGGRGRGMGRGGDRERGDREDRGDRDYRDRGDRGDRGDRPSGERGGRGAPRGDRGRGGRGGGMGGNSKQEAPKMDDEHDFPSLG